MHEKEYVDKRTAFGNTHRKLYGKLNSQTISRAGAVSFTNADIKYKFSSANQSVP